ncbi:hypothetical protein B4O97_07840 [Marispirochaeta aestuarii]|uniref:ABC transmembrane type-1 domain-containing protein n=1 Tax=Marispirochaeta aestuarii TaxID=1963862 RepID=A0A1Y1RZB5_9SPIO|nr:sugar ABC transporter permease [Marispirochaeta aestuarii]ORC35971.1 hypothetical protein B4O97_07840 [Marispirochaeta aestuarii]
MVETGILRSNKFFTLKKMQAYFFVLPGIIILLVLLVYPLIQVMVLSFFQGNLLEREFIGLSNYIQLFSDPVFWKALLQTSYFTINSVIFHFLIGLSLALILNQHINSNIRSLFRGFLIIPWLLAPTVAAMIWILIYNPFGMLNGLLTSFNLLSGRGQSINWIGNPNLSLLSVTVVNIWRGYPFTMVMLLAALQGIPDELYEAARIDGASPIKSFFYITIPALKGTMFTVGLLDIIWTFRHFDIIFAMTGGGPMNSSEVMTTHIYNLAFRSLKWGYAAAEAVIMFLVMLIFSTFYIRNLKKGETGND